MKKEIKNGLLQGIIGAGTMLIIGITYASTVLPNQTLTADLFNQSMVPSTAVMAFNSSTCPDGWKIADGTNGTQDLRDEFIRGAKPGDGREVGTTEDATHIGKYTGYNGTIPSWNSDTNILGNYTHDIYNNSVTSTFVSSRIAFRPQNVALLFCEKE